MRTALLDATRVIAALNGDGPVMEVRHRQPDGESWGRRFFQAGQEAAAAEYALAVGGALDTFVSTAPRVRCGGKNSDVARAFALFGDADEAASLDALALFAPRPSIVIASGGVTDGGRAKLHAYWLLAEAIGAASFRASKVKLAHHLGSDRKVVDEARVARVPGTFNFKDGADGSPVRLIAFEPTLRYRLDEVVGSLPEPPAAREDLTAEQLSAARKRREDDAFLTIPARRWIRLLTGERPNREGYVRCPFHKGGQERRPSLKPFGTGWACFGCPREDWQRASATCLGGDLYIFAAKLWGYPLPLTGPRMGALIDRLCDAFAEAL